MVNQRHCREAARYVALVVLTTTAIAFWCVDQDTAARAEGCGCHDGPAGRGGPHQTGSSLDHALHNVFLGRDDIQVAGIPGDQGPITVGQHGGGVGGSGDNVGGQGMAGGGSHMNAGTGSNAPGGF